jgi:hypothetical protein
LLHRHLLMCQRNGPGQHPVKTAQGARCDTGSDNLGR